MRACLCALLVFLAVDFAFAQGELISAPSPNLQPGLRIQPAANFKPSMFPNVSQPDHYWETDDQIRVPFASYKYLPGRTMAVATGFAPASLEWPLSGKHKFLPVLDLTVIKLKPGEPLSSQPHTAFGSVKSDRGHVWNKAKESMRSILR